MIWVVLYCRYGRIISTKAIIDQQTGCCKGKQIMSQ